MFPQTWTHLFKKLYLQVMNVITRFLNRFPINLANSIPLNRLHAYLQLVDIPAKIVNSVLYIKLNNLLLPFSNTKKHHSINDLPQTLPKI